MSNSLMRKCFARHTASRRDNYECVLLLITRGGRLDLRNKEDQLALEVCPDKHCHSALLLALNMKLQQFTQPSSAQAEKLLSKYVSFFPPTSFVVELSRMKPSQCYSIYSDITRGKEANPIQCVNSFDDEQPPTDYVYVTENCFTSPLHVDRTINSLLVH